MGQIFSSTDGRFLDAPNKVDKLFKLSSNSQYYYIPAADFACGNLLSSSQSCNTQACAAWPTSGVDATACKYPCSSYLKDQTVTCTAKNCDPAGNLTKKITVPCGTIPCATTALTNGNIVSACNNTCGTGTETRQPGCIAYPNTTQSYFTNIHDSERYY